MQIVNYTIPDNPHRLPELIKDLKKIYDVYNKQDINGVLNNDRLAKLLNYKGANNGSYQRKLKALRDYGLIEGRTDVKVSLRGESILYSKSEEKERAILSAFLSLPLWNNLFETYGKNLPTNDFWLHIKEITGCSSKDAQETEGFIKEAFAKDVSVISDKWISTIDRGPSNTFQANCEGAKRFESINHGNEDEQIMALLTRRKAYHVIAAYLEFLEEEKIRNSNNNGGEC